MRFFLEKILLKNLLLSVYAISLGGRAMGGVNDEETYSLIFNTLRHPIRRRILRMLSEGKPTYTQIMNTIGIDSGHLNYHLDSLRELLSKTDDGRYRLSSVGRAAYALMSGVEEVPEGISKTQRRISRDVVVTTLLTLCLLSLSIFLYVAPPSLVEKRVPVEMFIGNHLTFYGEDGDEYWPQDDIVDFQHLSTGELSVRPSPGLDAWIELTNFTYEFDGRNVTSFGFSVFRKGVHFPQESSLASVILSKWDVKVKKDGTRFTLHAYARTSKGITGGTFWGKPETVEQNIFLRYPPQEVSSEHPPLWSLTGINERFAGTGDGWYLINFTLTAEYYLKTWSGTLFEGEETEEYLTLNVTYADNKHSTISVYYPRPSFTVEIEIPAFSWVWSKVYLPLGLVVLATVFQSFLTVWIVRTYRKRTPGQE